MCLQLTDAYREQLRKVDRRSQLLSRYAKFLARENRASEAVELLRGEIEQAQPDTVSSRTAARLLAYEFEKQVRSDDQVLWNWLANQPKWEYPAERLLWRMLENAERKDLDRLFTRAEGLAAGNDPTRARTLGWIMNRMRFAKRSIPLLKQALENADDDQLKENAAFTLFESYLDTGDWKRAEQIYPLAARHSADPHWRIRTAVMAAKSEAKSDALRIWQSVANVYPAELDRLRVLAQLGLKDELTQHYRDMRKQLRTSEIPERALKVLAQTIVHGPMPPVPVGAYIDGGLIFGNEQAANLVKQARIHDPNWAKQENRDIRKAIALYEKAIAAQPGAKINAMIANRIGQLYGFTEDPTRGVKPDPAKAAQWWARTIEYSESTQLIWAQAHIGSASAGVMQRDGMTAITHYQTILDVDPKTVQPRNWQVIRAPINSRNYLDLVAREQDRYKGAQIKAVEKIHYVLSRRDKAAALREMQRIAEKYAGSHIGDKAQEVLAAQGSAPR